ncbi:hypothetical protein SEA_WOFFORD_263 [Streptomyces phage Wofford]|uniref:Uncharacterized protein n=1 Tax=Streptomyces phage Wofford TaxID=2283267 RepID=A0A345MA76_9CAUD|nr:hypothetical protein HWB78_gp005 [Streptomyces phage Wollford]YP_009839906.1 hypothetical protein HWB78_gp056 [Streptomyces phage Wollford]AXH67203.1 hypothetical protein SEA_WOFFORD_5 [Streptomyces phage Wollford]AXH67397.1 hypothetical protein SEA_WOFFORD_263 [Streptomyces phage Wollford]
MANNGDIFRQAEVSVIAPDVYQGARVTSTRRSPAEKDADKILSVLDKRTFNPHVLAYLMCSQNEELQKPLFDLAIAILNAMAAKEANGTTRNDEEYNRCSVARFVIEQMIIRMGA